ncbi:MAG: GNAT family N-acetyltransferase [Candidatus Kariarchaeaceae archaeon]
MKELTERELDLVVDFFDRRYKLMYPRDPPGSNELRKKQLREEDPHWKDIRWVTWNHDKNKLIGFASLGHVIQCAPGYEENKNSCWGNVLVDIDYRKQGIGTELLIKVFQKTLELEKTNIGIGTAEEAGKEYVKHIGIGIVAIEGGENRLYMEDVDWSRMRKWINDSTARKEGVTIETFEDVPEKYLEEYSKLYTYALNLVPKGEEEWEAVVTPEVRRKDEQKHKKKGTIWITKVSKEVDGKLSGLTEIFYNYENDYLVEQELTGIVPECRSRGLGKWLKAEMLHHINEKFPKVKFIATGNADINTHMVSINTRMGYKKTRHWTSYKFVKEEMESFIHKHESI